MGFLDKINVEKIVKGNIDKVDDANKRHVEDESLKEVSILQEEKKKEKWEYRNFLKKIENNEEICFSDCENSKKIFYQNGELKTSYLKETKSGIKTAYKKTTLSDVILSSTFGKDIILTPEIPDDIQKLIVKERIKSEWSKKWNKQSSLIQKDVWNKTASEDEAAFSNIIKSEEIVNSGNLNKMFWKDENEIDRSGHLAEYFVESFLMRLKYNLPAELQLPFDFETADLNDDAKKKIDFIIHFKTEDLDENNYFNRGVKIDVCKEEIQDCNELNVGVQWANSDKKESLERKQRAVEKAKKESKDLDDIVAVVFKLNSMKKAVKKYQENLKNEDNNFRMPDYFLDTKEDEILNTKNEKKEILRHIFGSLSGKFKIDVDDYWEKIKDKI